VGYRGAADMFGLCTQQREVLPRGPAGGIARPALGKPPAPRYLFRLFYLVEIRHRQLLQSQCRTRSRGRNDRVYDAITAFT
jgi:hypothetical protein